MKRKIFLNLFCVIFLFITLSQYGFATPEEDDDDNKIIAVNTGIQKIIDYKKSTSSNDLIDDKLLGNVFDFTDAKFVIALAQNNAPADYRDYAYVLQNLLKDKYQSNQKLNAEKTYTGAQISLALLACGVNPQIIKYENNKEINFLADTIYKRDSAYPLGKNGMEGYAWGLIALNAYRYQYDINILATRESFITELLNLQEEDGLYRTSGNISPYYLSALSVIALAPEYNNEPRKNKIKDTLLNQRKKEDEERLERGEKITFEEYVKKEGLLEEPTLYDYIDKSVDTSLEILSKKQSKDGSFSNENDHNIRITSSTIMALCAMGIDPEEDPRFIKNSVSLIDGLLKYQLPDGSFRTSESSDVYSDTIDAYAALVTYKLFLAGKRSIYDFAYKPLKQNYTMLRISDKDIENLKYINQNFDLSKYSYVCIINEKLLNSNRPDKQYWLSIIENIKLKNKQHETIVNYINEKGSELLYSETGVNVIKKAQIQDLMDLCQALPKKERSYITIYPDLEETTKKVQNTIALETLLLAVILMVMIYFALSLLMYFIKKNTLRKKISMYSHYDSKITGRPQMSENNESTKNKKMPFELEDAFFDYESEEEFKKDEFSPETKSLPFEEEDFFEYESPEHIMHDPERKDDFILPFEENTDFFNYETEKSGNESDESSEDKMPFEKEKNFFKYK